MKNNTQDKKQFKDMMSELKTNFLVAIKDKKRWIVCIIEILIVTILIVIDLLTKKFIYGACKEDGKIVLIDGVLSFTAVENTGAGFGIFEGKTVALTVVSVICAAVLLFFIFYSYKFRNLWLRSALILILSGAIGNIIDRIALGYVRDFVYFELINFAVFNFADSCLTIGTIVLIIYIIFFYSKDEKLAKEKAVLSNNNNDNNSTLPAQSTAVKFKNNEVSDDSVVENTDDNQDIMKE